MLHVSLQYIEHLEKLKKVTSLNLSGNIIERIERLEKLTRLRELNLSYNNISKIENLEALTGLQHLNLTGNQIEFIPIWLAKKLKLLRNFRIAKNEIGELHDRSITCKRAHADVLWQYLMYMYVQQILSFIYQFFAEPRLL